MRRLAIGLALGLALAACSTPTTSAAPISAAAAGTAAIAAVGGGPNVRVVSSRLSVYGSVTGSGSAVDATTPVWVVVLSGTFAPPSCGPRTATPHPCPSPATSAQVLIDARTGEFLRADLPAPSGG